MIRNPEIPETIEQITESFSIEWDLPLDIQKKIKSKIEEVFKKGGKIYGLITENRKVILGDTHTSAKENRYSKFREFGVYPIKDMPAENRNTTKNQIYAALFFEPISLSEILKIDLSTDDEMKLRAKLMDKVANFVDNILNT